MPVVAAAMVAVVAMEGVCRAAPCPLGGASLRVELQPAATAGPTTAIAIGILTAPSCDDAGGRLPTTYAQTVDCQPDSTGCTAMLDGLRPGEWTHRILVTAGEGLGQFQARTQLLLDRTAGTQVQTWPLYRSVQTVVSLDDTSDCTGCLRDAIAAAKPALIQFATGLAGTIRLSGALPALLVGNETIDGFDSDGVPLTRTIDANGLNIAALRIV